MATATNTEDELLIISDDDIMEDKIPKISENKKDNDSILDFSDTEVSEDIDEPKKENTIDFDFDL